LEASNSSSRALESPLNHDYGRKGKEKIPHQKEIGGEQKILQNVE